MSARWPKAQAEWPRLIHDVRVLLMAAGKPWVIENVSGAKRDMQDPVKLSGGMFGLGVDRPRLFESSFTIRVPKFKRPETVIGIYGKNHDGRRLWTRSDGSILRAARTLEEGHRAMGIDWMVWHELTEAIPPAYTEFIGRQLIEQLEVAA
jgi:DNA (cytosine-5)-methyltransferase 1